MRQRPPDHPSGWYVLAFSDEVAPGALITRTLAGRDVVVFRTGAGRVAVSDAFCPHLGAHLGHGGDVVGDTVRCPFHHFRFDTEGACVAGYPGRKAPPACRLAMIPARERNGTILAWWSLAGEPPGWEVPTLEGEGWRPLRHTTLQLAGHPQECSENSVDFGHFAAVHGYDGCEELVPAHVDGPLLHAKYRMQRARPLQPHIATDFEVWVWGLGYSIVRTSVERFGVELRTFVLPCPTASGQVDLRLAISLRKIRRRSEVHPLAVLLPTSVLEWVIERLTLRAYVDDVRQDFSIWENKTFLDKPRLAAGDGPVSLFRRYARQFYPAAASSS